MQIKTTVRCHASPTGSLQLKRLTKPGVAKDAKHLQLICTTTGNGKIILENYLAVFIKAKHNIYHVTWRFHSQA